MSRVEGESMDLRAGVNLFSASFFDADLAGSKFNGADMKQVNLCAEIKVSRPPRFGAN